MIDTLRLTVPGSFFDQSTLVWLQSLQSKILKTNYDGTLQRWAILSGVDLPSWTEGFSLVVGNRVTLEASPKIYQGHNIDGPDDLMTAASNILHFIFGEVFGLTPNLWPSPRLWFVARLDVTYSWAFGSFEALDVWMDTVSGVQRGRRRAGVEVRSEDDRDFSVDAVASGRTLYIGKGSRYRVGKIYAKSRDLLAHPPRCLRDFPDTLREVARKLDPVGRFESQVRALYLSRNAVKLGLVPAAYAGLDPVAYAESVKSYLVNECKFPETLHSTNKRQPIVYFPVQHLHNYLDLRSLWDSEFSHFFVKESVMNDTNLIKELFNVAPSAKQAQAAFNYLMLIRAQGLAYAKSTVAQRTHYHYRKLLLAAGLSDAALQDGAPLVKASLDPVKIREFRPDPVVLRVIEDAHKAMLPGVLDRLRAEVFKIAA
jgi:hypothetical protein